jgi:heme O synthase-like polyprenyltransferase
MKFLIYGLILVAAGALCTYVYGNNLKGLLAMAFSGILVYLLIYGDDQ